MDTYQKIYEAFWLDTLRVVLGNWKSHDPDIVGIIDAVTLKADFVKRATKEAVREYTVRD